MNNETQMYLEHEGLIHSIARKFCYRFPHLDYQEVCGVARIAALEAIRTHDPTRSKLYRWIVKIVTLKLIDETRGNLWQRLAVQSWPVCQDDQPCKNRFDYFAFLKEVSEDAQKAVTLAINNNFTRGVLRQVLFDLGWSKYRIQKTFEEIREAL